MNNFILDDSMALVNRSKSERVTLIDGIFSACINMFLYILKQHEHFIASDPLKKIP